MRAIRESMKAQLIRPRSRTAETGRQTSNAYEFMWGPILQGEGDTSDTLPSVDSLRGRVTHSTPTGVSETTPLEVKNINHHQVRKTKGSSAPAASTVHQYCVPEPDRPSSQKVDVVEPPGAEYASSKEELKAIYLAKTGERFPVAELDAIESMLVASGITWEAFVGDVRGHARGRITSPEGFLKNRAKKFRGLTQVSRPPVTAAEAADKGYRRQFCASPERGKGVLLVGGKEVPCSCASEEYVAHLRTRGIFPAESPK
jgi:hypothetical protein